MRTKRWRKATAIVVLLLLVMVRGPGPADTQAQGGILTYGTSIAGAVSPDMPLMLYSFSGMAGDRVAIDVIGLEGTLEPVADLIAPDRQTIASSRPDRLTTDTRNAHITDVLPASGVYSLMIGGADGTTGNFLLQLAGHTTTTSTPLTFGQEMPVTLSADAAPQYYSFVAESCPTMLSVLNPSEGNPVTLPFVVTVTDERGQHVATLRGGETLDDRVTVAPLSGTYEVQAWLADPALGGSYTLLVTCAGSGPACIQDGAAPASVAEPEACPECPPCAGDETTDTGPCADFQVVAEVDGGEIIFSWTLVEDAQAVIWSLLDERGSLLGARMVDVGMGTTDAVNVTAWGLGRYTIIVEAWAEELGTFCAREVTVEVDELGPVEWGPGAGEECSIRLEAPRDFIANGLQTFFWSVVPGAEGYEVHVSNSSDTLIASASVGAPATSLTLDTSEGAIGPGTEFYLRVFALRGGEFWCMDGAIVQRH